MKKLALALTLLVAIGCCPVPVRSISEVKASVELARKNHLQYVEKDASLKEKDKDDWRKFYESQIKNIEAIEKAHE